MGKAVRTFQSTGIVVLRREVRGLGRGLVYLLREGKQQICLLNRFSLSDCRTFYVLLKEASLHQSIILL